LIGAKRKNNKVMKRLSLIILVALSVIGLSFTGPNKPTQQREFYVPQFFTTPEELKLAVFKASLPDFSEDDSWTSAAGWYKSEKKAEAKLEMNNPYYFLHHQEYDEVRYGIANEPGQDGLPYWTYYSHGQRLFSSHIIGTGSGFVHILSMSDGFTWNSGDIALITPGTYNNYQTGFQNLTGLTIMNNGGIVTFNATLYCQHLTNTVLTGTGWSGDFYGFKFGTAPTDNTRISFGATCTNSTFDHFQGLGNASGIVVVDTQNGTVLNYDGANSSTKLLFRCHFSFFQMNKEGQINANFRGDFGNVMDSCTWDHWVVDSSSNFTLISNSAWYRDTISYWLIRQQSGTAANDIGSFQAYGTPVIHHCLRTGQNWGHVLRSFVKSLNTASDVLLYSNINNGNTAYGMFEVRLDTINYATRWTIPAPHLAGSNAYVINNTGGNMKNQSNYVTPIMLNYYWADLGQGFNTYAVNNLRYTSHNASGLNDTQNVVFFGPGPSPIVSNNRYYANPITSNILSDTSTDWFPTVGSPILNAGNPNFKTLAPTDYNNVQWLTNPTIGAVDLQSQPVAVAGPDQTAQAPVGFITLDGTASHDPIGTITAYHWSQTSGPNTALFGTPNNAITNVSNLIPGIYIFTLTITDNNNASASDQVQVTILPAGSNIINVQRTKVRTGP
jgi:hypothetical protein